MRKSLWMIALGGFLAIQAVANPWEGERTAWFYSGGYLVKDAVNGGWSETISATETFYFQETGRTSDYVQLWDTSRKLNVRLYRDAMLLKATGETQYRNLKPGRWDSRRMFYYTADSGKAGYFQLIGGGMYRHFFRDGTQTTSTYFRETLRNDSQVQVLDPRSNIRFSLLTTEAWEKVGDGAWFKARDGRWR